VRSHWSPFLLNEIMRGAIRSRLDMDIFAANFALEESGARQVAQVMTRFSLVEGHA
jgi:hypothetical protein